MAGIYKINPGVPEGPSSAGANFLIVNGTINARELHASTNPSGFGKICLNGSTGTSCISKWSDINTSSYGESFNTDNQSLSLSGTTLSLTNGGSVDLSALGGGGGITEIVDGDGAGGISVVSGTGPVVSLSAVGGSTGVSKIIAGTGISVSPASGAGNVTISANLQPDVTCIGSLCVKHIIRRVNCSSNGYCAFNNNLGSGCPGPIIPMPSPVVISGHDFGARDGSYFCKHNGGPSQGYDYCGGGGSDASYADYDCTYLIAQ
ncbi:hypothetical protein EPN15_01800 [Patescibacteria group bacterium]|nr:MAG: hypothetical protein EPN15_01800 [Patescibacteria group bacterium]